MRIYLPLVITSAKLLFKFGRNEWIYGRVVCCECVCVWMLCKKDILACGKMGKECDGGGGRGPGFKVGQEMPAQMEE